MDSQAYLIKIYIRHFKKSLAPIIEKKSFHHLRNGSLLLLKKGFHFFSIPK